MSIAWRWGLAGVLLALAAGILAARDGTQESRSEPLPRVAVPSWSDGRLYLPKSLQRHLGIRTVSTATQRSTLRLPAVVRLHPDSEGRVDAPEAGYVEGHAEAAGAWPLPGQRVERNQLLALLRPALSEREKARRRVELAQLEQRRVIARVNVERLRVQVAAADGKVAPGNIYFEQAQSELRGLDEAYRARVAGLDGQYELRSPVSGRLTAVAVTRGQAVAAGQTVFTVAGSAVRRLELRHAEPRLLERLAGAKVVVGAGTVPLILRGQEPVADGAGWRLLLDAAQADGWWSGQVLDVDLSLNPPNEPCQVQREVWIHVAAEWFERRSTAGCDPDPMARAAAGERRVVQGAMLLSGYLERSIASANP